MTSATITVDIPSAMWLSSNHRHHWRQKAARTADIRTLARHACKGVEPVAGPVVITAHVGYPPRVHIADAPNAWDSIKPAIDGIVDAGVLIGDDSAVIVEHRFLRDPERTPRGRYRLTIHITTPCLHCHRDADERVEGLCRPCQRIEF